MAFRSGPSGCASSLTLARIVSKPCHLYEPLVAFPGPTADGSMQPWHAAHLASPSAIPPVALHHSQRAGLFGPPHRADQLENIYYRQPDSAGRCCLAKPSHDPFGRATRVGTERRSVREGAQRQGLTSRQPRALLAKTFHKHHFPINAFDTSMTS